MAEALTESSNLASLVLEAQPLEETHVLRYAETAKTSEQENEKMVTYRMVMGDLRSAASRSDMSAKVETQQL